MLAGDRAAKREGAAEDLVERRLGAGAGLEVVGVEHDGGVQVAVAGVAEGGAHDLVPPGDLGDVLDHRGDLRARHGDVLEHRHRGEARQRGQRAAARGEINGPRALPRRAVVPTI